jgi:hypothetical protein
MRANMPALAAGRRHSAGRRWDGTVIAVGSSAAGECRVGRWEDVVSRPKIRRTVRRTVLARGGGPVLRRLAFSRSPSGRFSTGRGKQPPGKVRRRRLAGHRRGGGGFPFTPLACALTVRSPAQGTMPAVSATPTPDREFKLQVPEPEQRDRKPGRAWGYIAGSAGSPLLTGSCPVSPVQPGFGVLPPQHRGLLARCHVPVAVQHRHREGFACTALSMLAADADPVLSPTRLSPIGVERDPG